MKGVVKSIDNPIEVMNKFEEMVKTAEIKNSIGIVELKEMNDVLKEKNENLERKVQETQHNLIQCLSTQTGGAGMPYPGATMPPQMHHAQMPFQAQQPLFQGQQPLFQAQQPPFQAQQPLFQAQQPLFQGQQPPFQGAPYQGAYMPPHQGAYMPPYP